MKTVSIIVSTIFCLLSCKDVEETKVGQNVSLTVEELTEVGINNFNNDLLLDSISKELNNLIITDTSYYKFYISDFFDKNLNQVQLSFHRKYYNQIDILSVHFHGFEICIIDNETIFIDGMQNELNSINNNYLNYYHLHNNGTFQTELKEDSINFFGKIQVPDLYAHIGLNIKPDKVIDKSKWKYFFYSINEIISCYNKIREDVAKERFKKSFQDLNQKEKESVIEYRPLKIMISFDMEFCSEMVKPKELVSVKH